MKKAEIIIGTIIGLLVISLLYFLFVGFPWQKAGANGEHQIVCFCHNVKHNPHTICTSNPGLIDGHLHHVAIGFDTLGECQIIPTPTKKPTPTPVKDCDNDTDGSSPNKDDKCITPTPTVTLTPTPTATPEATPPPTETPQNNNSGGNGGGTPNASSPTCNISFPAPILQGFAADGHGSVSFSWWGVDGVDKYSIIYGYSPDSLIYGQDNLPANQQSVTLNGLTPGVNVWAKVYAWKGQCAEISNILDPKVL